MAVIYLCPADKRVLCSWEGPAGDIKQHFESEHNELLYHTTCVEIDLEKLPENKLLSLEEGLYLMQAFMQTGKVVTRLRYLGSMEAAAKFQYEITVSVGDITYRFDPSRYSCVVPRVDGWEIHLETIERLRGKVETLTCNFLVAIEEEVHIGRKISNASINSFEEKVNKDLLFLEEKIEKLKRQKIENELKQKDDYMDRISVLNFSMLEEPFDKSYETFKTELEDSSLCDIPEEVNLSCPSCDLTMLPPIYLCIDGHNVCYSCRTKPCKICNSPVTINRNIELENTSRTHSHQCRYASDGCNEKLYYNELRAHEAKCNFCKYKCMSDGCPYLGKFDHFTNHLKVVHASVKVSASPRSEFPKGADLYIANQSIGVFYCTNETKDDFVIWRATFCGPSERQFSCEISFRGSKYKEAIFLKRKENVWEMRKPLSELKKNKAKEKHAVLTIISFDS